MEPIRSRRINEKCAQDDANAEYFSAARVGALRRQIEEQGVLPDSFLAEEPDCPVFGLNLACAYPFADSVSQPYNWMAGQLAGLDPAVYVYPLWQTHLTIMTLANFSLHRRPAEADISKLQALAGQILQRIRSLRFNSFALQLQAPVLTRQAAIIPMSDSKGEIARLRSRARELIEGNPALHSELLERGMTAPGIIHSTIMRFKAAPQNLDRFIAGFQAIAASARLGEMEVNEIFLTEETRPYMREGRVLERLGN